MRFSNSSLSLYRSCPLKYALTYEAHLVPLQPPVTHDLRYGQAVASAMEALYGKDGSVTKARAAFAATYPETEFPDPLPFWSQGKSFSNAMQALKSYAQKWRDEDQYWEVLEVENLETMEDDAAGGSKVVRLDLVVKDTRDGQIYGVDTKSTGKYLDTNYWANYEPHSQIRTYTQYITDKYGYCGGFVINAISFKHRSKSVTPRKGPNKGILQPAGFWHEFGRMTFNPNSACLKLEQDNIAYWVGRIKADKESRQWGYNTDQCHRGGVECEYYKLCSAGYSWPDDDELILGYYRQACLTTVPAGKCQLDIGHEGEHDARPTVITEDHEIVTEEEEAEDAVVD